MPEYSIGDALDGYVLTARGWVSALDLDPSPYRPGDVVNGYMLGSDLDWQPLRNPAAAPYRTGDVVDGYTLTPAGDWRPLGEVSRHADGSTAGRAGVGGPARAVRATAAAAAAASAASSGPNASAAQRTQARAAQAAAVTAAQRTATATRRTAAGPRAQTAPATPRPTAARSTAAAAGQPGQPAVTYRIGDKVNGYVLTPSGWVPLSGPTRRGPAGSPRAAKKSGSAIIPVLFFVGLVLFNILRSCTGA
ncbi:MAG: hypothetical protein KJ792_00520 [Actinobacteria bacterium]|nr:hypothetical protein [Actinomycetota bacterium]MCG2801258.1 hypothetical protein [Cellulomonas sp.]